VTVQPDEPILHLSMPVSELERSRHFYVDVLGCEPGRVQDGSLDVFFYGCQVTLHERPDEVLAPEQRGVRHFGVTLTAEDWSELIERLRARGHPVRASARHRARRDRSRAAQGHGGRSQRQRHRAQDLRRSGDGTEPMIGVTRSASMSRA
jgi:extradiol dioxygenase family protein